MTEDENEKEKENDRRMRGLFLILLLVYVVSATRCIVKDDKVRRYELSLPNKRVVQSFLVNRDHVLIVLGPSPAGRVRGSRDPLRRSQWRVSE